MIVIGSLYDQDIKTLFEDWKRLGITSSLQCNGHLSFSSSKILTNGFQNLLKKCISSAVQMVLPLFISLRTKEGFGFCSEQRVLIQQIKQPELHLKIWQSC